MRRLCLKFLSFWSILPFAMGLSALAATCHASASLAHVKFRQVLQESGDFSCLSGKETELLNAVNDYRVRHGLQPIANSRSLNKVARVHAIDLFENRPADCSDGACVDNCTLHSWSNQGFWTPVCYTNDHRYADKMWYKTREITNYVYPGEGYENAYWTSDAEVAVERVLECWKQSPSHNALLLQDGIWKGSKLLAFGVGIYKNVAVIWIGNAVDPLGSMATCGQMIGRN